MPATPKRALATMTLPSAWWAHPCAGDLCAVDGATEVLPPQPGATVQLDRGRYIINPGSVGQPRDGDPAAAYLLVDTVARTFGHRRVAYDVDRTQTEMRARSDFRPRLIARLDFGW